MFLYYYSILGSEEASQADLKKQSSIIVNFWHKSLLWCEMSKWLKNQPDRR